MVNGQHYGDTELEEDEGDSNDDEAGWMNDTTPGSGHWPSILNQGAFIAVRLLGRLLDPDTSGIGRSGLRGLAEGYWMEYGDMRRMCRCSERVYQMLFLLRLAGIHCRELGGMRLGGNLAVTNQLDSAQTVGHRIIEVWDDDTKEWFVVDSTSLQIGPELPSAEYLTTVRGFTGIAAPLYWGYASEVFAADDVAVLRDGSPESASDGTAAERYAGAWFNWLRMNGVGLEDPLEELLDWGHCRIGARGARVDVADAQQLKAQMAAVLAVTADEVGTPYFPLYVMWFSPLEIPARENACVQVWSPFGEPALPPPACTPAFVGLVLALAGPRVGVDVGLWFTRRFLLLPTACSPPDDVASAQRLADSTQAGPIASSAQYVSWGSRGRWAWDFIGNLVHFAGSAYSEPEGDEWPRYDCPAAGPEILSTADPLQIAQEHGPPQVGLPWERTWSTRLWRDADYIAALGRDPVESFKYLKGGRRQDGPLARGSFFLRLNRWGDLTPTLRAIEP